MFLSISCGTKSKSSFFVPPLRFFSMFHKYIKVILVRLCQKSLQLYTVTTLCPSSSSYLWKKKNNIAKHKDSFKGVQGFCLSLGLVYTVMIIPCHCKHRKCRSSPSHICSILPSILPYKSFVKLVFRQAEQRPGFHRFPFKPNDIFRVQGGFDVRVQLTSKESSEQPVN